MNTLESARRARAAQPAEHTTREEAAGRHRHVLGGALAGIGAGLGMFVVLAAFALSQGRGVLYPVHAVHGLMSGARVIPDHPRQGLVETRLPDVVMAPLYFLAPAVLVGVLTALWLTRRGRRQVRPDVASVGFAVLVATALFLLLVVVIGFRETSGVAQRSSSGYGVQELGTVAWVSGHAAYVLLLIALLAPATRIAMSIRRGRPEVLATVGEERQG
jgi:hypothetical protein